MNTTDYLALAIDLEPGDLDELVQEAADEMAQQINEQGVKKQIEFLVDIGYGQRLIDEVGGE